MKQLELNNRKVAVIGCGFVGATSAFGLMQSGLFSEMVLIDANTEKAEGRRWIFPMESRLQDR